MQCAAKGKKRKAETKSLFFMLLPAMVDLLLYFGFLLIQPCYVFNSTIDGATFQFFSLCHFIIGVNHLIDLLTQTKASFLVFIPLKVNCLNPSSCRKLWTIKRIWDGGEIQTSDLLDANLMLRLLDHDTNLRDLKSIKDPIKQPLRQRSD